MLPLIPFQLVAPRYYIQSEKLGEHFENIRSKGEGGGVILDIFPDKKYVMY